MASKVGWGRQLASIEDAMSFWPRLYALSSEVFDGDVHESPRVSFVPSRRRIRRKKGRIKKRNENIKKSA